MRALALGALALLAACAAPEDLAEDAASAAGQAQQTYAAQIADRLAPVSDRHRPERACLIAAGFLEVQTAKAALTAPERRAAVLGRGVIIRQAVARLRETRAGPWRETEMGHVVLAIAGMLGEAAADAVRGYLRRGLSPEAALFAGRNLGVEAVLQPAVWADVRRMLAELDAGLLPPEAVWDACEDRMDEQARGLG